MQGKEDQGRSIAFAGSARISAPGYHSNRNVYQTNSPEFEVGNGKNYQCPKKSFWFLSRSFRREPWHCSADIKGPLSVNLPELPIRNFEEFEVGNGKNYIHSKKSPVFFNQSVKILVRMVLGVQRRGGFRKGCRCNSCLLSQYFVQ